jgi:hypothetical protein
MRGGHPGLPMPAGFNGSLIFALFVPESRRDNS